MNRALKFSNIGNRFGPFWVLGLELGVEMTCGPVNLHKFEDITMVVIGVLYWLSCPFLCYCFYSFVYPIILYAMLGNSFRAPTVIIDAF